MLQETLQSWLAENSFARRAAESVVRRQARQLLTEFDRQDPVRAQRRILRGLVHAAHATPFGRARDFVRLHEPGDFRRLVPLTSAVEPLPGIGPSERPFNRKAALTAVGLASLGGLGGRADAARALVRVAEPRTVGRLESSLPFYLRPFVSFRANLPSSDNGSSFGPAVALESVWHALGPIALEDPRHGQLRLLADHGIFFEFVPAEEIGKERPARRALGEIDPGAVYAVALTTGAGVWACLTDVAVAFERRNPPLLRALPLGRRLVTIRAPHRQIAGIPAARPEMLGRTPLSALADRG